MKKNWTPKSDNFGHHDLNVSRCVTKISKTALNRKAFSWMSIVTSYWALTNQKYLSLHRSEYVNSTFCRKGRPHTKKEFPRIYEGHTISFQTFFVWAFRIVIDSWKFSMLLLYILWDDWPISYDFRFKWIPTAGIGIHHTIAGLSQLLNFKNAM